MKGRLRFRSNQEMVWCEKCKVLFCSTFLMPEPKKPYSPFHLSSALFMIMALLWLTISAPFVYASLQEHAKVTKAITSSTPAGGNEEEAGNPFGNNTEEKTPNNYSSFSEEYLHDHHLEEYFFSVALRYHKCENSDTYVAYHGEVQVPPPNAA